MLNSRAIAIQGFAYSPVTIAVQGFIAQLEEEQSRYGGGGRHGGRARTFGEAKQSKQAHSDADLVRLVNEKYEAIEQAQKREAKKQAEIKTEPAKEKAKPVKKIEAVALQPLESPFEAQAEVKRQTAIEDEQIMALMCQLLLED